MADSKSYPKPKRGAKALSAMHGVHIDGASESTESITTIFRCYERAGSKPHKNTDEPGADEPGTEGCPGCGDGRLHIRSWDTFETEDKRCANCTSTANTKTIGSCPLCRRDGQPLQESHKFGRRVSPETWLVCKACHLDYDSYLYG